MEEVGTLEQIHLTTRSPDGTLSPVETLSDRQSHFPTLAVGQAGTVLATWRRDTISTGKRIQVSVGP